MSRANALWALDLAMDKEREGHEFYLESAEKTADAKGKRMFRWLAGEELKHLKWVEQQRLTLIRCKDSPEVICFDEPIIKKSDFPPLSKAKTKVKPNTGELEALHIGIEAERDSIILYTKASNDTSEAEGKAMFARLVQEEEAHLDILEEEYEWLRQTNSYFTLHRFQLPGK